MLLYNTKILARWCTVFQTFQVSQQHLVIRPSHHWFGAIKKQNGQGGCILGVFLNRTIFWWTVKHHSVMLQWFALCLHQVEEPEMGWEKLLLPWKSNSFFARYTIVCVRVCLLCWLGMHYVCVCISGKSCLTLTFLMQLVYWCTDEQEFAVVSIGLKHWQKATGARSPSR